ncbi:putative Protein SAP1 [Paratrimastix pyriformis]|uniref:microtubule-severing ATPase n=1 Tax=Paratrimastix pyriformis TaxID=342808 RepID=A0ABQ8UCC5_9EUKA|nr:putative Protein SAP1 [Paratrimastix pyriformis]
MSALDALRQLSNQAASDGTVPSPGTPTQHPRPPPADTSRLTMLAQQLKAKRAQKQQRDTPSPTPSDRLVGGERSPSPTNSAASEGIEEKYQRLVRALEASHLAESKELKAQLHTNRATAAERALEDLRAKAQAAEASAAQQAALADEHLKRCRDLDAQLEDGRQQLHQAHLEADHERRLGQLHEKTYALTLPQHHRDVERLLGRAFAVLMDEQQLAAASGQAKVRSDPAPSRHRHTGECPLHLLLSAHCVLIPGHPLRCPIRQAQQHARQAAQGYAEEVAVLQEALAQAQAEVTAAQTAALAGRLELERQCQVGPVARHAEKLAQNAREMSDRADALVGAHSARADALVAAHKGALAEAQARLMVMQQSRIAAEQLAAEAGREAEDAKAAAHAAVASSQQAVAHLQAESAVAQGALRAELRQARDTMLDMRSRLQTSQTTRPRSSWIALWWPWGGLAGSGCHWGPRQTIIALEERLAQKRTLEAEADEQRALQRAAELERQLGAFEGRLATARAERDAALQLSRDEQARRVVALFQRWGWGMPPRCRLLAARLTPSPLPGLCMQENEEKAAARAQEQQRLQGEVEQALARRYQALAEAAHSGATQLRVRLPHPSLDPSPGPSPGPSTKHRVRLPHFPRPAPPVPLGLVGDRLAVPRPVSVLQAQVLAAWEERNGEAEKRLAGERAALYAEANRVQAEADRRIGAAQAEAQRAVAEAHKQAADTRIQAEERERARGQEACRALETLERRLEEDGARLQAERRAFGEARAVAIRKPEAPPHYRPPRSDRPQMAETVEAQHAQAVREWAAAREETLQQLQAHFAKLTGALGEAMGSLDEQVGARLEAVRAQWESRMKDSLAQQRAAHEAWWDPWCLLLPAPAARALDLLADVPPGFTGPWVPPGAGARGVGQQWEREHTARLVEEQQDRVRFEADVTQRAAQRSMEEAQRAMAALRAQLKGEVSALQQQQAQQAEQHALSLIDLKVEHQKRLEGLQRQCASHQAALAQAEARHEEALRAASAQAAETRAQAEARHEEALAALQEALVQAQGSGEATLRTVRAECDQALAAARSAAEAELATAREAQVEAARLAEERLEGLRAAQAAAEAGLREAQQEAQQRGAEAAAARKALDEERRAAQQQLEEAHRQVEEAHRQMATERQALASRFKKSIQQWQSTVTTPPPDAPASCVATGPEPSLLTTPRTEPALSGPFKPPATPRSANSATPSLSPRLSGARPSALVPEPGSPGASLSTSGGTQPTGPFPALTHMSPSPAPRGIDLDERDPAQALTLYMEGRDRLKQALAIVFAPEEQPRAQPLSDRMARNLTLTEERIAVLMRTFAQAQNFQSQHPPPPPPPPPSKRGLMSTLSSALFGRSKEQSERQRPPPTEISTPGAGPVGPTACEMSASYPPAGRLRPAPPSDAARPVPSQATVFPSSVSSSVNPLPRPPSAGATQPQLAIRPVSASASPSHASGRQPRAPEPTTVSPGSVTVISPIRLPLTSPKCPPKACCLFRHGWWCDRTTPIVTLTPEQRERALARLRQVDVKLQDTIKADILQTSPGVRWGDIIGLENVKQVLTEMVVLPSLRPDLFVGLRSPPRGLLLYGPPGTGKTMIARALATEAKARFFAMSASALMSKYVGEGEKLVRALFAMATAMQPSIIFIDEIDSILSARSADENEASRRLKTEFLVQLDGVGSSNDDRVVFLGATNRPQDLDDAIIRRLSRRIYLPLPDESARRALIEHLMSKGPIVHRLSQRDMTAITARSEGLLARPCLAFVRFLAPAQPRTTTSCPMRFPALPSLPAAPGYSNADLSLLCREAAFGPVRQLGPSIVSVEAHAIRPVMMEGLRASRPRLRPAGMLFARSSPVASVPLADFAEAFRNVLPSVSREALGALEAWKQERGSS